MCVVFQMLKVVSLPPTVTHKVHVSSPNVLQWKRRSSVDYFPDYQLHGICLLKSVCEKFWFLKTKAFMFFGVVIFFIVCTSTVSWGFLFNKFYSSRLSIISYNFSKLPFAFQWELELTTSCLLQIMGGSIFLNSNFEVGNHFLVFECSLSFKMLIRFLSQISTHSSNASVRVLYRWFTLSICE